MGVFRFHFSAGMMKSNFRVSSKSVVLSRIKYRTFSILSANAQPSTNLVSSNRYLMSSNFTNGFNNRQLLNNHKPTVFSTSGFLISKNIGDRHFSSAFIGENFEILSKYLEGTPVEWFQNLFLWTHSTSGLPWWATIIINTVATRLCLFPLTLYQMHIAARLQNLQLELDGFVYKLKQNIKRDAQIYQWSNPMEKTKYYRTLNQEIKKMYIRDNCHPLKIFALTMTPMAALICQIFAVSNLCHMLPTSDTFAKITNLELSVGGFGWIKNLNANDCYLITPLYLGALSFCMLEAKGLLQKSESANTFLRISKKWMVVIYPLFSIFISAQMPAAVLLIWTTNNTFYLAETLLLATPKARKLVGIPKTINDHERPFVVLRDKFRAKYQLPENIRRWSVKNN